MKSETGFSLLQLLAFAVFHVLPASGAELYVSPSGNDAWSGTLAAPDAARSDGPLRTLDAARRAVRGIRESRPAEPVTVSLRGGLYAVERPVVFTPADSGSPKAPVVYAAYRNERPVLTGGRRIRGWKPGDNGLWVAEIPEVRAGNWYFRDLWIDGQRRPRARTPNEGFERKSEPLPVAEEKDINLHALRFEPGEFDPSWTNLDDVEAVVLQFWMEARLRIQRIDTQERVVYFTGGSWRPLTWSWGRYIENVFEALDQPGEWYLNRKTGILYYRPMPGEDMTKAEVIAPRAFGLIRLEGNAAAGNYVEHLSFRGLTFSHTAWELPPKGYAYAQAELGDKNLAAGGGVAVPASFYGIGVRETRIEGCSFEHLGAWAIDFDRGSRNIRIERNRITDLGAGAIKIGEPVNPKDDVDEACCTVISDNLIKDGSRTYLGSPAIWIGQSSRNTIAHNEVEGSFMWAVSVGWNWSYMPPNRTRDNIVEYNHLHHLGSGTLGMHGAVYTLGVSPGTVIRNNYIHDMLGHGWGSGWGIILDNGCAGILVENNVIWRNRGGGLNTNFNTLGNIIQNNIFGLGRKGQLQRYGDPPNVDPPPPNPNIFQRNLVYFREGLLYDDSKWLNYDMVQDYNLFFDAAGRPLRFLSFTFDEWKAKGLDRHSLVADPLFAGPDNGNFALKPGSPALNLGFHPIDLSTVGPRR